MKKETLIKMVELDGIECKLIKFGEEITELRFALIDGDIQNVIEELSQVNFIMFQLECYKHRSFNEYLESMVEKYNLKDRLHYIQANFSEDIKKREIFEYNRSLKRLGLVD